MNITTLFLNINTMYFIQQRWRSSTDHLLGNIKPPWPPSASYSHTSPWMSNTASKPYYVHRLTPATSRTINVSTCVPAVRTTLVLGSNSSNSLDSNTTYNDLYSVSVANLYSWSRPHYNYPVL